ncbi:MAG: hypothetical protein V6015_00205 [Candidatus Dasytiphilus stammeri]
MIFVFTVLWFQKIAAHPILMDKISVIVNNQVILQSDIDYFLHFVKPWSYITQHQIIKELILHTVLFPLIKQYNPQVSAREIKNNIISNINLYAIDLHVPANNLLFILLVHKKINYPDISQEIGYELKFHQIFNYLLPSKILVTPSQVNELVTKNFYFSPKFNSHLKYQTQRKNYYFFLTELYVRHIIINNPELTNKQLFEIFKIIARDLKKFPEGFSGNGKKYTSQSINSRIISSNKLEWILPQRYLKSLRLPLLKLTLNEITPPIFNENGWNLLQLLATRTIQKQNTSLFQEKLFKILENCKITIEISSLIKSQCNHSYVKILSQ